MNRKDKPVDANDIPTRISIQKTNRLLGFIAEMMIENIESATFRKACRLELKEIHEEFKPNSHEEEHVEPEEEKPVLFMREIWLAGRDIKHIYQYWKELPTLFQDGLTVYLPRKHFLRIWREVCKSPQKYSDKATDLIYTTGRPTKRYSWDQILDISLREPNKPNIIVIQDIRATKPYIKVNAAQKESLNSINNFW